MYFYKHNFYYFVVFYFKLLFFRFSTITIEIFKYLQLVHHKSLGFCLPYFVNRFTNWSNSVTSMNSSHLLTTKSKVHHKNSQDKFWENIHKVHRAIILHRNEEIITFSLRWYYKKTSKLKSDRESYHVKLCPYSTVIKM